MSAVLVYDDSKVYADIEVVIRLKRGDFEQSMTLLYDGKRTKGHTLSAIGSSIQRNIYEQLREGYARLLDQVAEGPTAPEDQHKGEKTLLNAVKEIVSGDKRAFESDG